MLKIELLCGQHPAIFIFETNQISGWSSRHKNLEFKDRQYWDSGLDLPTPSSHVDYTNLWFWRLHNITTIITIITTFTHNRYTFS